MLDLHTATLLLDSKIISEKAKFKQFSAYFNLFWTQIKRACAERKPFLIHLVWSLTSSLNSYMIYSLDISFYHYDEIIRNLMKTKLVINESRTIVITY